jgi:hypothetical protein
MIDESARVSVVRALAATLAVRLVTEVDRQSVNRAVHDYQATVLVRWSPDQEADLDALSAMAGIDAAAHLPEVGSRPEPLEFVVGRGTFATVDLAAPSCWEELSSRPDLRILGSALLGEDLDQSELRVAYPILHDRAVIAEHLEIDELWRGGDYGCTALELALAELGRDADVAALFPMAPGVQNLAARDAASIRLSRLWARAGFEEFNGVMARGLVG